MKKSCAIWLMLISIKTFCQEPIESYPLQITFNKTTNIIFSYPIKSVDKGSMDVLVQKAIGAANVLQLKARKQNFTATNLSVITADSRLHSFMVSYADSPKSFNLSFCKDALVRLNDEPLNQATLDGTATSVMNQKKFLHISAREQGMKLSLKGVYIAEHVLWLKFRLRNNTQIDYEPDYVKFFVRDRRRVRRTAIQQTEVIPLNKVAFDAVPGNDKRDLVFAFKQFTIPIDKELVCHVSEKSGGRFLPLHINHRAIIKARPFSNK